MTISSEVARIDYSGSGIVGPFPIPFKFTDAEDLLVVKTEAATGIGVTLVLTTDYLVTGAGDPAGGNLTLTAPLAVTHRIAIIRDPSALQLVDYTENDKFPAETHEGALDKLTMLAQRLYEIINRSIRVQEGDQGAVIVPPSAQRAGKYLVFDGAGNVALADGIATVPSLDSLTFIQAGTGAVPRGAQNKMRDIVNVKDFGAIGDGVADDLAAFQNAGGTYAYVEVPPGNYRLSASPVTNCTWMLATGVTFSGPGILPGTTIHRRHAGVPAWATLANLFDTYRVNVNNFPITYEFGGDTVGLVQGIVGAVKMPATSTVGANGVAGYATSESVAGAVGVYGQGGFSIPGGFSFGANFVASNTPHQSSPDQTGVDGNVNGIEVDLNIKSKLGPLPASVAAYGVYVTGGADIMPNGAAHAFHVGALGAFAVPKIPFHAAYYSRDGAAQVFADIGADGEGNNRSSQPIRWRSRTAGGVDKDATALIDPEGNFIVDMDGGILVIRSGGVDQFRIVGKVIENKDPLVALGGGAAPTLGTIGGTGPAVAAQNSWMRLRDDAGNHYWVPVWK